ncbi:MAG: sodium-dependent transporter [Bacteroidales bacterium]|nr:sodium-dependent transporter [Bacteroidales bacterium]
MTASKDTRGFTSNLGAIVAAAGSAIGLGNIWRFPYTVGQNGGGAFLLLYILFVFFLGLPIMMSEFVIGRRSQRNTVGAFRQLGPQYKRWTFVGVLGIVAAFLIYSFYSTVAGWTLNYVFLSGSGQLSGRTPEEVSQVFASFTSGTAAPLVCQLAFILLTAAVVLLGVQKGIEKCTKILMPLLLVLMLLLCVRSLTLRGSSAGLAFLFEPDFSKLTWSSVLSALGQALFSLSIGMGALVTYGSYIRKEDNLFKTGVCVAGADTLIALLSGIAIFPAVFAFGMSPASGPSLVYEVLPNVFGSMPMGALFAVLFFLLLSIAALTSTISLLEIVVLWAVEELHMKRVTATFLVSLLVFALGTVCTLSFGPFADMQIMGKTFFECLDHLTATYMMPIGALCIILFLGWRYPKAEVFDELTNQGRLKAGYFRVYYFVLRFLAPIALFIILIMGILGNS